MYICIDSLQCAGCLVCGKDRPTALYSWFGPMCAWLGTPRIRWFLVLFRTVTERNGKLLPGFQSVRLCVPMSCCLHLVFVLPSVWFCLHLAAACWLLSVYCFRYIKQLSINTAIVFFVIAGCFYAAFVG